MIGDKGLRGEDCRQWVGDLHPSSNGQLFPFFFSSHSIFCLPMTP